MSAGASAAALLLFAMFATVPALLVLALVLSRATRLSPGAIAAVIAIFALIAVGVPYLVWALDWQDGPDTCPPATECYDYAGAAAVISLVGALVAGAILAIASPERQLAKPER